MSEWRPALLWADDRVQSTMSTHLLAPRARRPLRRLALGSLAAASAGLLAVSPALGDLPAAGENAESRKAPNCDMRGSKTMTANGSVRVFKATNGGVYGCRRTADRAYRLGDWGECQNNDEITTAEVAGRYAGLVSTTCSLDASWEVIALVSLRSGRFSFQSPPLPASPDLRFSSFTRIVVDDRGGLAWIASGSDGPGVSTVEVRRRHRGSARASDVLASGPAIDVDSLRRVGHRVTWRKGGETFSAAL